VLKALALGVLLVAVAAACGGDGSQRSADLGDKGDRGGEVMAEFVEAANAGDAKAMWDLLSTPSQRRLGPTEDAFAAKGAKRLQRELAPFANGYDVSVSERITDLFGLVAIARGTNAYALPLRFEGDELKVEVGGPVRIDVLGPRQGSRSLVGQIGVEVHARGGAGTALLYVDGLTLDPRVYTGPKSATVFANLEKSLPPGLHVGAAYADIGDEAAGTAWTFTATR
jgi:hypothetical protein